jgi:PatG C-terminal
MERNFAVHRLVLAYAVLLGDAEDPFRNRVGFYITRNTEVTEKFCVRVDVTEESPFLVTKMPPYYDR